MNAPVAAPGVVAPGWPVAVALVVGVLTVSTAAILIRVAQAQGVESLAIAAWRLAIAALALAPFIAWRAAPELARLDAARWRLLAASGVFLAAHFAAWIVSLEYTSVASSVALVTTNPIWIALFAVVVLRERLPALRGVAIALALAGSAVILAADLRAGQGAAAGSQPALGNALALLGSWAVCGYFLIGRGLSARLSLLAYLGVVYAVAALCLAALAWAAGARLAGFTATAWLCLLALGLGPQLVGHGCVNYALRHVSPTTVALVVLGEPVGAAVFAWVLFDEAIGALKLAGIGLLLAGIFLAARSEAGGGAGAPVTA